MMRFKWHTGSSASNEEFEAEAHNVDDSSGCILKSREAATGYWHGLLQSHEGVEVDEVAASGARMR